MRCELYNEEWKDINGYEGYYQVSNYGRIRSVDRIVTQQGKGKAFHGNRKGRILKQREQNSGYLLVWLSKQGKKKKAYTVHRLVAESFLEKPSGCDFVNHLDGNKKHNYVKNLEWCTKSHNTKHAYKNLLMFPRNCICVLCKETGEIFNSLKEAGEKMQVNPVGISHVLHNRARKAGGYSWAIATGK